MKYAVIIVRTLIGLMFLFASIVYFVAPAPPPPDGLSENTKLFLAGLDASKYIMPITKIIELLCGLMFVSGRFVALGVILIFPIIVNILLINILHLPISGLAIVIPLFSGILFLAYTEREKYAPLFSSK